MPLLRKARGRIVNISSVNGGLSPPYMGPYSASKFALEAITDALRIELRTWGIRVSAVEPGPIDTPIWDKSIAAAEELAAGIAPEMLALYDADLAAVRRTVERSMRRVAPVESRGEGGGPRPDGQTPQDPLLSRLGRAHVLQVLQDGFRPVPRLDRLQGDRPAVKSSRHTPCAELAPTQRLGRPIGDWIDRSQYGILTVTWPSWNRLPPPINCSRRPISGDANCCAENSS